MSHTEIEVRFLEIDADKLIAKLRTLGAKDLGEELLEELIFRDSDDTWTKLGKRVRLRKSKGRVLLAYKETLALTADGTKEIEFEVGSFEDAAALLESIGLVGGRRQEKRRHSFKLGNVAVEIDRWPKIPALVELEGSNEEELKEAAQKLGLSWENVEMRNALRVIEEVYKIPVSTYSIYTFDKAG